jgi:AcrR family transcriptional regulator
VHVPRAFSERERDLIRQRLRAAGRQAFADFGLRRTAVDDLVRAAGISKGAFYLFYESKEELLLELLEQLETDLQSQLLARVLTPELTVAQSLRELLQQTVSARRTQPLLRRLSGEDLEQLVRRVPPERAAALRRADVASVTRWMYYWRARGVAFTIEAEVLTGLLRALLFASLREDEIGPAVYPKVLATLIEGVASSVIPESPEEDVHVPDSDRRTVGDRRARSLESRLQS